MNDGNENSQINNKDSISNIQNLDSNPYFTYFNNAPLALWIEDLSSAKSYLEIKAKEHNTDAKTYLIQNPDLANELAKMVVVKDVNQTAVDLYKAKSKEDLFQNLDKIFVESSYDGFATLLIDVFLGNKDSQVETVNKTLEGNEFQILLKFTITDPSLEHVIIAIEDISERVKIREQLTISKLRYKEAQAISKLGSWSYDFKSNEVYWSDEIYKTIGVDPQSFVPDLNFLNSLIIDEDKDKALDFSIDFLLKNRRQQLTYRILTPKKKLKYINEYRNVIVENNRIVKIAGTSQDITKSILAEQVLNDTKTLLSDTISSIKEGYILLDKNFNYTYVNEKAAGLVGKKSIDLIGKNIWEEFPEVINNKFQTHCFSVLENKKPISFESHIKPWNKWYESRIIPSNDGLLISFHEITEKIISKNKIKEAYNIINKSSSVAILFKNEFDFPIIFASENAQNLFGYTHEEFTGGKIKIHETVLSEDLPIIRDQVFQLLKNNTDTTIKPEPYRIVTKNKTIKWVKSNIDVIRNEEGYITHIQGIVEDYTDRKKVEDAFFKTNQLITDQFNNTPLASIITDISFNVIEWNNSAERIFGYSAKEAIGKNLNDLIILPNLKIEVQKLRESIISNKKGYKNTNENVRKDGEIIICDWYNVTLKDASNNVIGIASLADDITERKKTEVLLFEKNQ
ncbi:MAG: PAS domain S-box protein, partial [Lutibacter sp.]|nr:PAS domain S-box protein [Lutibacter sp.]